VDNLPTLIGEISKRYPGGVPTESLDDYCRRYLHYYHQNVQHQPIRFFGAWGWSEARRREFRLAFDTAGIIVISRDVTD
jgi:hypothetical protein